MDDLQRPTSCAPAALPSAPVSDGVAPDRASLCARAAEALLATELSVEAIAAAVGYASTSQVHRTFKRVHGRTPQQVRARQAPTEAD